MLRNVQYCCHVQITILLQFITLSLSLSLCTFLLLRAELNILHSICALRVPLYANCKLSRILGGGGGGWVRFEGRKK
jgi:hypothetical protein